MPPPRGVQTWSRDLKRPLLWEKLQLSSTGRVCLSALVRAITTLRFHERAGQGGLWQGQSAFASTLQSYRKGGEVTP